MGGLVCGGVVVDALQLLTVCFGGLAWWFLTHTVSLVPDTWCVGVGVWWVASPRPISTGRLGIAAVYLRPIDPMVCGGP